MVYGNQFLNEKSYFSYSKLSLNDRISSTIKELESFSGDKKLVKVFMLEPETVGLTLYLLKFTPNDVKYIINNNDKYFVNSSMDYLDDDSGSLYSNENDFKNQLPKIYKYDKNSILLDYKISTGDLWAYSKKNNKFIYLNHNDTNDVKFYSLNQLIDLGKKIYNENKKEN